MAEQEIKILLVEDYPANVLVASMYLAEFGYACDVATSGFEAVSKATEHPYAAILMDVEMPGMNGLDATQMIRLHQQTQRTTPVPIIGMTAHAMPGDRERCLDSGMDDYISKPFDPDKLQDLLRTHTMRHTDVLKAA
jgi:CheY-like chemotaxis protein